MLVGNVTFYHVVASRLGGKDLENAVHISREMSELADHVKNLGVAIHLFEESVDRAAGEWPKIFATPMDDPAPRRDHMIYTKRQAIAARDAAMTIWHYGKSLDGIKAVARATPILKEAFDWQAMRAATRLYKSNFPDAEAARHSTAHTAELTESPQQQDANAVKSGVSAHGLNIGAGTAVTIKASIHGRTYLQTFKGKVCALDMDNLTYDKLRAVHAAVETVFQSAALKLTKAN